MQASGGHGVTGVSAVPLLAVSIAAAESPIDKTFYRESTRKKEKGERVEATHISNISCLTIVPHTIFLFQSSHRVRLPGRNSRLGCRANKNTAR